MSLHDGKWWVSYAVYVAACVFCVAGGFLVGRYAS